MLNRYKKTRLVRNYASKHHRGAAATETLVVLVLTVTLLLLAIQLALIFHVKLTLQYAAHEAARIGALNNGMPVAIPIDLRKIVGSAYEATNMTTKGRDKFGVHLNTSVIGSLNRSSVWDGMVAGMMPLFGTKTPDKDKLLTYYGRAYKDLLKSTCIEYLNPTQQAFTDWGFIEFSGEDRHLYQIPTDTLRYRKPLTYYDNVTSRTATDAQLKGSMSNKTLAEANVLHLRINYGYKLSVPIANKMILAGYTAAVYLTRSFNAFETSMLDVDKLPLSAEGAVGMQSPLHWHPFYSFGPAAPRVVVKPDTDFDSLMSGNDLLNFEIMNTGMKAVSEFAAGSASSLLKKYASDAQTMSQIIGNGIAFCPATWLPEKWRD